MDVLQAIRQRRSHRAFDARQVEHEKIDVILEAACWAPSPANSQPWEFVVITGQESRDNLFRLSETARDHGTVALHGYSYIRPLPFQSAEEEESIRRESLKNYSFAFLKKVPVIVAVVGLPHTRIRATTSELVPDGYKYACAAAIQNMLLATHAQGLGSLWFTFFDQDLVSQFLNIEPGKHLLALVCIGYPAAEPHSPGRQSLESKSRYFD